MHFYRGNYKAYTKIATKIGHWMRIELSRADFKISSCSNFTFFSWPGVDQSGTIILKYKGGQMANLIYSTEIHSDCTASICGTKGQVQVSFFWWVVIS